MRYYEVFMADGLYRGQITLTYQFDEALPHLAVVIVPLKNKNVVGFVTGQVDKPDFNTKAIKSVLSSIPLPDHCLKLAQWLAEYYAVSFGEALGQFAPSRPAAKS